MTGDLLGIPMREDTGRGPDRRRGSWIVVLLAAVILGGFFIFALRLVSGLFDGGEEVAAAEDYPGPGAGEVVVQVMEGDADAEIGERLVEADVVASVRAFTDAASARFEETGEYIQPGHYRLQRQMPAADAVEVFFDGESRVEERVVVVEGITVEAVLNRMARSDQWEPPALQTALEGLELPAYADGNPEGFLHPATYRFGPDVTEEEALAEMLAAFNRMAEDIGLADQAEAAGFTPYEILTMASIIEREAADAEEYGRVSRVIHNRLERGMTLGMNATLNYVLPEPKAWLTDADLEFDSPYNTHRNLGLPPTPIGNPSRAAIEAALAPEEGDWLYFVAFPDGRSEFASDENEFYTLLNEARTAWEEWQAEQDAAQGEE